MDRPPPAWTLTAMTHPARRLHLAPVTAASLALCLAGCGVTDPYAVKNPAPTTVSTAAPATTSSPGSPGERLSPPPPTIASQHPADVQTTPMLALRQFADLYINWTYRTLQRDQQTLAAIAVGPARLAEQQAAAASAADTTITRGQIYNTGQLISAAPSLTTPGEWVLVSHETTGGNPTYDGLQAAYHVTLATVAAVPGGYAITQWQPQD
jgi:hypothetical protein